MKIIKLEVENVKRVKAVKIEPERDGLTILGGKNGQGKTSVLDAIAWALGGEKYRPTQAQRDGSVLPPEIHLVMDNGLVVERKGKNSALKVIDPQGRHSGQQLLNEFVEQFALDLPRFLNANAREKAQILLRVIGVGDALAVLDRKESELYNRRLAIGQIKDQKVKYAKEMTFYPDAPKEPQSASELIRQQQDILIRNAENQRKRENLRLYESEAMRIQAEIDKLMEQQREVLKNIEIARKSALDLRDESTAELEKNITDIEEINRKVRANLDKDKAEEDAKDFAAQYDRLTLEIEAVRGQKTDLLHSAALPLPDLIVEEGELKYKGYPWDSLSGADQLKVATAIVRALNPNCGFILIDKLEQMDTDTLREFGEWLKAEQLQAIATRVSTGGECSVIITDGTVEEPDSTTSPKWEEGVF